MVLTAGQEDKKDVVRTETPKTSPKQETSKTVEKKVETSTTTKAEAVDKNDLFFAIQVASSKTQVKDFRYLKLKYKVEELKGVDRFRYYVGKTSSYEKALDVQKDVRKTVKDCFVIAIYKGKQITVAEAKKLEQKIK